MFRYLSRLKKGYIILLMQSCIGLFAFSFVPLFLKEKGYSSFFLVFLYALYTGVGVLVIPLFRRFYLKKYLMMGFLCFMMIAVLFVFYIDYYSYYLYALLEGFTFVFFWIPLNYLFFRTSSFQSNATDSSLYMTIGSLLGIFIPLLGGLVIKYGNYQWLFGSVLVLDLIPLYYIWKNVSEEQVEVRFFESISSFKGLKTITFCEGSLHFFGIVVIPIYTLLFLKAELSYGLFLSYVGIVGAVVGLSLSHYSDKSGSRKKYLFPLFFMMVFSILILSLVHTFFWWMIAVGFYFVLATISDPLRLAVSLDSKKSTLGFWSVREFFLNLGRVVTLALAALFFYFKMYWPVFVLFALIVGVYPFLIKVKLKQVR